MPNTTTSTNMSMPIPVVGVDYGPDWANNLNACLNIVDSHDHTSGSGVQITPSGLNVNADLSFGSNNATQLRTSRYTSQTVPLSTSSSTDIGCVYVAGLDLYYNDVAGNQVRITQSGGVAGSPGSISNLVSPASASYVALSQTFVWQSAANTPANLDLGGLVLRNVSANSKGLTLIPPAAMGVDTTQTLPATPGAQAFVTLDSSGNYGTPTAFAGGILGSNIATRTISHTNIAGSTITTAEIAYQTITGSNIATSTVQRVSMQPLGQTTTAVSGIFPSTSIVAATTIATNGRPVMVMLYGNGSTGYHTGDATYTLSIRENGGTIGGGQFDSVSLNGMVMGIGSAATGTATYDIAVNGANVTISGMNFVMYGL